MTHFKAIEISSSIEVTDNGLVAIKNISQGELLLSIQQNDTICFSTIPISFRNITNFMQKHMEVASHTGQTRILDYKTQTLLLYLIHLRLNQVEQLYKSWFSRPLTALYYLQRRTIEESDNLDLLIHYVAEHNQLEENARHIFQLINKSEQMKELLGFQEGYNSFKERYVWSDHFVNNRSFGYSNELTLIPIFDMMNHSSNHFNVCQELSLNQERGQTQQDKQLSKQQNSQSDNQSEESQAGPKEDSHFLQKRYRVFSVRDIQKGQEIFIKYGSRNNKFLLEGYGFVQQHNPCDSLNVFLNKEGRLFYDSVRGQGCSAFKFKRKQFNMEFFLANKQRCYSQFYSKDWQKIKVIWSLPRKKQFQMFFIRSLLQLMRSQQPPIHQFSPLKGSQQLQLYEKERRSIFKIQIDFVEWLLAQVQSRIEDSPPPETWPIPLQQYCRLLLNLKE